MGWDPDRYLRFADHRLRPGLELIARIPDVAARTIVDLGCGTGHLTAVLGERWPGAAITGLDASDAMIERAQQDYPQGNWVVGDIEVWEPAAPCDLIYSNAALHWLDDHARLFRRLRSYLAPGGVVAVQMPDNWAEPTHRVPADLLDEEGWPDAARTALMRDRLGRPADYASWVAPAEIDIWRTTYHQRLEGEDPVWVWVTGSLLRPVLDVLEEPDRTRFADECRRRYRAAYPPGPDGSTLLPFSRLFIIATAR